MIQDPDHALIDRILAGEQNLYAMLVDRYKGYAFTIALKILQHRGEAEEVAQDAFIKAFHGLKGFNRESKFSTWLYRIAFNTAVSYKRKNRHIFESIGPGSSLQHAEADTLLEKTDKQKFVQLAMAKLNEADRTALTLFYLEEFSLEEIAVITNISVSTLKVRVHRARLRVAGELKSILNQEALTL